MLYLDLSQLNYKGKENLNLHFFEKRINKVILIVLFLDLLVNQDSNIEKKDNYTFFHELLKNILLKYYIHAYNYWIINIPTINSHKNILYLINIRIDSKNF